MATPTLSRPVVKLIRKTVPDHYGGPSPPVPLITAVAAAPVAASFNPNVKAIAGTSTVRADGLSRLKQQLPSTINLNVETLENEIYNSCAQKAYENSLTIDSDFFADFYHRHIADILAVFQHGGPPAERLLAEINEGSLSMEELARQKSWDLFPDPWQDANQNFKTDIEQMNEKEEATCHVYQCPKCKKSETKTKELQTRSSDEPMTLFIRCVNCKYRWKIN